ncbi:MULTISPECIES: sensor histidine kinase [Limnochorda]|uniref:sensor histidine kinase n=1 Tax=Limnochorda TaxID=1676651 RepID=UPI001DEFF4E5|nr:sensor histidine kinase [Limnochorda pilosa]MBO2486905.1 histidine kinase [Bacillota bacterium]MBO2519377.1 histidine kinase [Bacillota bacterium]
MELELTSQRLEEVLARITTELQEGRAQIQAMADEARMEEARLTRRLQELQLQLQRIADQVDRAAQEAYRARHRLMVVNRDFSLYTEDEIRQAYQEAQEAQLALATYQERERLLRQQRDEQELTVRTVRQLAERADVLVAQVSVALDFLQGNLEAMSDQLQDLRARQEMGRRVIASVEEERRRLAREIHDGPAQALANLAFRAEICQRLVQALFPEKGGAGDAPSGASPGTLSEELERIREGVLESLREIRTIISNLRPMALDDLGLVPALRRFLEGIQTGSGGPQIDFHYNDERTRLQPEQEAALFRVAQEAVQNALRHARAQQIIVRLEFSSNRVSLLVADDGVGFDREKSCRSGGRYGLMHMRERVEWLHGTFQVESRPGQGTRIRVQIPTGRGSGS